MSQYQGTGTAFIGSVPWDSSYKNVFLFGKINNKENRTASETKRNNYFKSNFTKIKNNLIFKNPNSYIDVNYRIKNVNKYNYLYFEFDAVIDNLPFCCFITDFDYLASNVTRLYIQCDVWQTYAYNTQYYESFIERGIITKSDDIIGKYTQNEPIRYPHDITTQLQVTSNHDWSAKWNLFSVSLPKVGATGEDAYIYGGYLNASENATGGYFIPLTYALNPGGMSFTLNSFVLLWLNSAESHAQDLIDITAVPTWLQDDAKSKQTIDNDPTTLFPTYRSNANISIQEYIRYTNNSLASNYIPKNKKMYTSLANSLILYNRNGLRKVYKPELIATTTEQGYNYIVFRYSTRPIQTNSIQIEFERYKDINNRYYRMTYGASLPFGFNSNQGLSSMLNKITAIGGLVGSVGALASTPMTGVTGAVTGAMGVVNSVGSVASAFDPAYEQVGKATDVNGVSASYIQPKYLIASPTYDNCKAIDDFLSCYGYALNTTDNITNYTNNRNNWDYIQCKNAIIRANAPTNYQEKLKDILNSGVHIWHNLDTFGDFSQDNN